MLGGKGRRPPSGWGEGAEKSWTLEISEGKGLRKERVGAVTPMLVTLVCTQESGARGLAEAGKPEARSLSGFPLQLH